MKILVIDSALSGCAVGVYDAASDVMCASESVSMVRGQAEALVPMVEAVLGEAGLGYDAIDKIAVTKGPGAFTGMRIGLATARALGLSLGVEVRGVTSFDVVLQTYLDEEKAARASYYGVLLETKRKDYYYQGFNGPDGRALSEGQACDASDVLEHLRGQKEFVLIGDAGLRFRGEASSLSYEMPSSGALYEILQPSPLAIARVCCRSLDGADRSCNPLYIRPPDVSLPKVMPRRLS